VRVAFSPIHSELAIDKVEAIPFSVMAAAGSMPW